jgi:hypothetical protein
MPVPVSVSVPDSPLLETGSETETETGTETGKAILPL